MSPLPTNNELGSKLSVLLYASIHPCVSTSSAGDDRPNEVGHPHPDTDVGVEHCSDHEEPRIGDAPIPSPLDVRVPVGAEVAVAAVVPSGMTEEKERKSDDRSPDPHYGQHHAAKKPLRHDLHRTPCDTRARLL